MKDIEMKASKIGMKAGKSGSGKPGPGASMAASKASAQNSYGSKMWKALDTAAEFAGWNQDVARSKLNIQKHKADTRKILENKKRASPPPKPRLRPASGKKK